MNRIVFPIHRVVKADCSAWLPVGEVGWAGQAGFEPTTPAM